MRLSIIGLLKLGMHTVRNAVRLQWNDQSIHAAGWSDSKLDDREALGFMADPGQRIMKERSD